MGARRLAVAREARRVARQQHAERGRHAVEPIPPLPLGLRFVVLGQLRVVRDLHVHPAAVDERDRDRELLAAVEDRHRRAQVLEEVRRVLDAHVHVLVVAVARVPDRQVDRRPALPLPAVLHVLARELVARLLGARQDRLARGLARLVLELLDREAGERVAPGHRDLRGHRLGQVVGARVHELIEVRDVRRNAGGGHGRLHRHVQHRLRHEGQERVRDVHDGVLDRRVGVAGPVPRGHERLAQGLDAARARVARDRLAARRPVLDPQVRHPLEAGDRDRRPGHRGDVRQMQLGLGRGAVDESDRIGGTADGRGIRRRPHRDHAHVERGRRGRRRVRHRAGPPHDGPPARSGVRAGGRRLGGHERLQAQAARDAGDVELDLVLGAGLDARAHDAGSLGRDGERGGDERRLDDLPAHPARARHVVHVPPEVGVLLVRRHVDRPVVLQAQGDVGAAARVVPQHGAAVQQRRPRGDDPHAAHRHLDLLRGRGGG